MTLPPQVLSPLDGRYREDVAPLGEFLSEAGLNRARTHVEVEWIIFLAQQRLFGTSPLSNDAVTALRARVSDFGQSDIDALAKLESVTRHDVKAVEYLVRSWLDSEGLSSLAELTHITCTSEDINNLSYALTVRDAVEKVWLPACDIAISALRTLAERQAKTPMLSRTHGQPATPTTLGKEMAVFVYRLDRVRRQISENEILGKFSGASGNFAAHRIAEPEADWPALSKSFVESLGLTWNPLTTQIESHDWQAELYARMAHANRIVHNAATDIWTYISLGYFRQIPQEGATGSSTMPHKINPIRFENAEANLEISCALLDTLAATLVTSRMQRDLTDSSTQRNIGVAFGHSLLALHNMSRGLAELDVAVDSLAADLEQNWEVLGEAIQTVIRAEVLAGRSSISDPYALLKELTRGKRVTAQDLSDFVSRLDVSDEAKKRLIALTPATYVGDSAALVEFLKKSG
jgi:adenylosuccinate lyase